MRFDNTSVDYTERRLILVIPLIKIESILYSLFRVYFSHFDIIKNEKKR